MTPNGSHDTDGREVVLNRVLADLFDALARGDRVDLQAWQDRYPAFATELADLVAARREVGVALGAATPSCGERGAALPCASPPVGVLGDYELLEELGHGGMGRVYKARQRGLGRLVALKVIRAGAAATAEDRLRFRTEAEAAGRLDHPNIVPVYEVGEHDGQPYLAARYVKGQSLNRHLDRFRDDHRAAAVVVATLARAIHHAHQRGVLHRDLKPGNVLLEWRAGNAAPPVPHITDFGLARLLDHDSNLTRTSDLVGTPSYMAPEQASGGSATITTATDVYGLGAILYAVLTGHPPFAGRTVLETLEQVRAREPDSPRRRNPKVDRDLETICLACLAKDPRRRYASALALAEDLDSWLNHLPIAARPAGTLERLAKWVRRHPAATAFACVSVAAVVVALAASLWHTHVLSEALADSDRLRREGLAREARLRDHLYVADMQRAKEAWDSGDLPHLADLLERQRPADGEADRRGFEWYWLKWCLGTRAGTLKAHDGGLLCAAVSPDDCFLVTGDRKGTVKVWDLGSRRQIATLPGHTDEVQQAVFSADGRALATCSKDQTVRLWDVATWTERECLRGGHSMTVRAIAFTPDGKQLASAGRDRCIVLWDLAQGRAIRSWQAHDDVVHDLAFAPDGRTLVSVGTDDRTARFWDPATGAEKARWWSPPTLVHLSTLALSPDGKTVAAGGYGSTVSLWGTADLGATRTDLGVPFGVRALAFAPSGLQLVAVGGSGQLSAWEVNPGSREAQLVRTVRWGGGNGRAAIFARKGALLVTASEEDGTVQFWDPVRLAGYERIAPLPPRLTDVALSPDGQTVVGYGEGHLFLLDLAGRRIAHTLPLPVKAHRVAFSPDGRTVAAACQDRQARLWDVTSTRRALVLDHGAPVLAVAFSPTGGLVATAWGDGNARLWELPSGALRKLCGASTGAGGASASLAFTRDGRTLAVGATAHTFTVSLRDPTTGALRGELTDTGPGAARPGSSPRAPPAGENACGILAVAFSPDGTTLAAACSDGILRLWDVQSGELRNTFSGHVGPVHRLAFAPDGRTLASLGTDNALRLWHLGTGQPLFTLAASAEPLAGLAFSADGRLLVAGTGTHHGTGPSALLLWRAEPAGP
jgi:WD40 repeat protein